MTVPPVPSRRDVLLGAGAAAVIGWSASAQDYSPVEQTSAAIDPRSLGWDPDACRYVLPDLPYGYDALEPHIDEATMRLHHDAHHAGYVRGLNTALVRLQEIRDGGRPPGEIKHWSRELAFHGSGHLLHVVFWNCMTPGGGGRPRGMTAQRIDRDFGSFTDFADLTTRPVSHTVLQPAHLCPASIALPVGGFQFENLAVQVPGADVVFLGALARFGTTPLAFDADFDRWIETLHTARTWGRGITSA